MNIIDFQTLIEVGFVPSIIIIGGWVYALILLLVCVYQLILYIIKGTY